MNKMPFCNFVIAYEVDVMTNVQKKIPKYKILRIYLTALFIYFMLVFPVLVVLTVKNIPSLYKSSEIFTKQLFEIEKGSDIRHPEEKKSSAAEKGSLNRTTRYNIRVDSSEFDLSRADSLTETGLRNNRHDRNKPDNKKLTITLDETFALLIKFVIPFILISGFVINIPYKRFFNKKRKKKIIQKQLEDFCRKTILYTPYINAAVFFIGFMVFNTFSYIYQAKMNLSVDQVSDDLYKQFIYISIIASILITLFVYYWQRHRVQMMYLPHVFRFNELLSRKNVFYQEKIRNRLLIASGMTTLLPLSVVMIYLILGLTPVSELGNINEDKLSVLLGPYIKILPEITLKQTNNLNIGFYVNYVDNVMMIAGIVTGVLVALIYIAFFVHWTTASLTVPLKEILENMKLTASQKTYSFTFVRTNDEIGELAEGYNKMTNQLIDYIKEISAINLAYLRFVPKQFLQHLNKKTLTEIELGDQVQREMTVLFSDIRGFTEISEAMTPKENFDFINEYLGRMEPIISSNNGFIDKYIGDSIMALFPEKVDDAVNAAVEMNHELKKFNFERIRQGKQAIEIGTGIHIGNLMLGIVGGHGRMDGTVISDAVNLASRLEGLTKIYGSSIIISEDALLKLKEPHNFTNRLLDTTRVKGKRALIRIFEIIDCDGEENRKMKMELQELFSQALDLYHRGNFEKAFLLFELISTKNPEDMAAHLFAGRCKTYLEHGIKEDEINTSDPDVSTKDRIPLN